MARCALIAGDESGESPSLTATEAFTRFVEMKALYQKERAATRRNEIMLDQLAVHMETKLMEIHQEKACCWDEHPFGAVMPHVAVSLLTLSSACTLCNAKPPSTSAPLLLMSDSSWAIDCLQLT